MKSLQPGKPLEQSQYFSLLIVEDEPDMAELLAELARACGFNTHIAHDVQTGLGLLHSLHPDVVLTDLRLPDGSGQQIIEAAQGLDGEILTVMITGYASLQDAIEAFKFGLFDLITKPFDTQLILNLLERLYAHHQHRLRMQRLEVRLAQLEKKQ